MSGQDWARLFRIACSLIRQVNSEQTIINSWSFGGGTAMMLQIGHRESHDIDIFLPDAQFLPFLDPKLRDFEFDIRPSDYRGDGAGFLKLAFEGIGEIDFIVGPRLTAPAVTNQTVEGEKIALETVAEIITKKVHYRGASIKPISLLKFMPFDALSQAGRGAGSSPVLMTFPPSPSSPCLCLPPPFRKYRNRDAWLSGFRHPDRIFFRRPQKLPPVCR